MVHLHLHTEYSLLDSIIKIPDLIKKVKDDGHEAVSITDHGTLGGVYEFWKECKDNGIKPIIGCEFYHSKGNENYHIILLAKNKIGFENLVKLNNLAIGNFYKRPRITDEMIVNNCNGLIGLTACLGGYFAQSIIKNNVDWTWYKNMKYAFGGDFFLEIQRNGIKEQDLVTDEILRSGVQCVATVDAHYLNSEDAFAHEVALGIRTNKKIGRADSFRFSGHGYYIKTIEEMRAKFPEHAIHSTDIIASKIEEYSIGYDDWQLPVIDVDSEKEYNKLFNMLIDIGIDSKEYKDRLIYEFNVIKNNGFLPYFVIISDLCRYFDDRGSFRGWGRGSVSGSLVSYLYNITKIDPIKWNLYFERFLNPDRITPPDIDLDFMPDSRTEAIKYFKDRFGEVYQISTYGTLSTKEVIKTTARIMGIETSIYEYVPAEAPIPTVKELIENSIPFIKQIEIENNRKFIDVVLKLEGLKRNLSIHSAGIVISDGKIPLRISKSGKYKDVVSTSWDMYTLEGMKFVKFDILGVKNLEIINKVLNKVGVSIDNIPLDDKETLKLIQDCKTIGVFQWESSGYQEVIKKLRPDNFDELLDLNTLYRPGCLNSGITEEYIERKFGRRPIIQLHHLLNMERFGLPLYQEDIMKISVDLAGFTLSQADKLRKAIGKKEKETFKEIKDLFIDGCKKHMSDDEAIEFWEKIEKFARYTWNKAHSVAYTLISWWTAYLSTHYTAEFLCELLNQADSVDRRRVILSECRRRGIIIEYPDVNVSDRYFKVIDGKIFVGLSGIKFVGDKTLDKIFSVRENGVFNGFDDFVGRTGINKRALNSMCDAGVFGPDKQSNLEGESKALGYCIKERAIDLIWWSKYCDQIGEIIDIHKITTKTGKPMAFIYVEFFDRMESITVFPDMWSNLFDILSKNCIGLFKVDNRKVLIKYVKYNDFDNLRILINDAEGFMSFRPSCIGRPNIYVGNLGISKILLNDEVINFIDKNFGIDKILVN